MCAFLYVCTYVCSHVHCTILTTQCTVPDIIKFAYYHCTSIDYNGSTVIVWVKYTVLWIYYTVLHLSTMLSHTNVKGIHILLWLQYKVVL